MAGVRSSWLPLLVCSALSVVIHAGVVLGLAAPGFSAAARPRPDRAPDPDEVRLGIENSVPVSIAWIGFSEATPHAAFKAETLQPELSVDAIAASAAAADQAVRQAARAAAQASESLLERLSETATLLARSRDTHTNPASSRQPPKPSQSSQPPQKPSEAEQQAKPAPTPPTPPTKQAIKDDRESSATSPDILVRASSLGKVIARQGLRIQTFHPQYDATTKQHELRSYRGRVTAVIHFAKDGSVVAAVLKPGTESGVRSIDEPILDSVYRWRASGRELQALPDRPGAFIAVNVQFLF